MNAIYCIKSARSDHSSVCIKEACSDIITQAIENISDTTRDCDSKTLNLVWAPWHDIADANSYSYKGPSPVTTPTKH
eukprot:9763954-Ditylum_brightwellii.AAC.1